MGRYKWVNGRMDGIVSSMKVMFAANDHFSLTCEDVSWKSCFSHLVCSLEIASESQIHVRSQRRGRFLASPTIMMNPRQSCVLSRLLLIQSEQQQTPTNSMGACGKKATRDELFNNAQRTKPR